MNSVVRDIRHVQGAVIVAAGGEVTIEESPGFHKSLVAVCEQSPSHLVIDLTEVSYIDSSGVGSLVDIFRRVRQYNGRMCLVGLTPTVRSVFEITKLDRFFIIYATQGEALAS